MWQSLYSHKKKCTNEKKGRRGAERKMRKEERPQALCPPQLRRLSKNSYAVSTTASPTTEKLPRRATEETPLVVACLGRSCHRARQSRHTLLTHATPRHAHAHTLAHTRTGQQSQVFASSSRLLRRRVSEETAGSVLGRYDVLPNGQHPLSVLSHFRRTTPSTHTHTQPLSRLHQTLYIKRHPLLRVSANATGTCTGPSAQM